MKSKTEKKLDEEFEKLGEKPRIFHFLGNNLAYPYAGITIADLEKYTSYEIALNFVNRSINRKTTRIYRGQTKDNTESMVGIMTEEPTLRGFVARLQAQRTADSESLSYAARKYLEAVERVKKKGKR